MATKPTPPTVADPPLRSLGATEFVTRSEAWFTFEAGPFYTYIVDGVNYIDDTNLDVQAAAVAANLFDLPLTNLGGYLIGVNNTEDGFEAVDVTEYTVTAYMETLLDDADAATARSTLGLGTFSTENTADFVQDQATWNTGTDTTESTITPAKLEAKLADYIGDVDIGPAYASLGAEDIGSVGFFQYTAGSISAGATTAASNLAWGSVTGGGDDSGPAPASGTWMALSYHDDGTARFGTFKRIL